MSAGPSAAPTSVSIGGQAGFKNDFSTIDHIFTMLTIIQKRFVNNRKLYVAFIDFEKAFDSISIKLLWPVLLHMELRESCTGVLKLCMMM